MAPGASDRGSARVERGTGDLKMQVEGRLELELITSSVRYEAWQLNRPGAVIVALAGLLSEAKEAEPGLMVGGAWE